MSRKQRLFIGLARQLVGLQAAPAGPTSLSPSPSPLGSREPSPGSVERQKAREERRDEYLTAKEAENIYRRGEKEADIAARGAYSEKPATQDTDDTVLSRTQSKDSVRSTASSNLTAVNKRESWNQPADMSASELAEANARLMARLRHFLAIPMANSPISIFFYNDKISKQRTVYTNPSGHFSICAALDFVPTHVRVLASDKLSATEEILVTESRGISVISDIDDTIKHSAISSGAREIFRNAFIRDLGDLTIEGVREWYNRMAELGVKFHYVSNSPWQLFPVISKYFAMAGLPPGSFHLKQYSGMLQGIFEPVAERKKGTLDKIARDFPERRFILIGDSGEADLEVYTDFALENPGRIIAIFIRDVTTTEGTGFFDPSVSPVPQDFSSSPSQGGSGSISSKFASSSSGADDEDPEMRAAIAASLRQMEEDKQRRSKSIFPSIDENHPRLRPNLPPRKASPPKATESVPNLIDLSSDDEGPETLIANRRSHSDADVETEARRSSPASNKSAPPPPRKPISLRSASADTSSTPSTPSTPQASPKPP
jgi:phosphatidate phosphatase APP1